MAETILRILEFTDGGDSYDTYEGYVIFTDEQEIKLEISNYQSCCESWGYFMSEDNLALFEGATLLGVDIVDSELRTYPRDEWCGRDSLDGGDVMFVNLRTSNGTLQFVAYNSHNGYYGHSARVASRQLTKEVIV